MNTWLGIRIGVRKDDKVLCHPPAQSFWSLVQWDAAEIRAAQLIAISSKSQYGQEKYPNCRTIIKLQFDRHKNIKNKKCKAKMIILIVVIVANHSTVGRTMAEYSWRKK